MSRNITEITTYNGYEIGSNESGQIFVSKCIADERYTIREIETVDEAYEYIDALTVNSDN